MEGLIVLTILGIIGLVSPRRWRRLLIYLGMGILLFFGLFLSPPAIALANWGLVFSLPPDSGEIVDSIVVLGRGEALRERRIEVVSHLWQAQRASYIFVSGMSDASIIANRLKESGIPEDRIGGENCSESTEENVGFTTTLLRPRQVKKILLVTDSPHMLRSLLLFRSFGLTIIPYASSLPPSQSSLAQMASIVREYGALAQYALTARFKERSPQQIEAIKVHVRRRVTAWKCQI